MIFTILIAFFSLIGLLILHEFGHFILAKKFGVQVEEFGIGYPPRLFGKKVGETIYSLNLFPFGAFVKLAGEIEKTEDKRSFSSQPVWKRALIVLAGVISFWLMAAIIFSIVFNLGARVAVEDKENSGLIEPRVQIAYIAPNSPAAKAEMKPGDAIKQLTINEQQLTITKVKEIQELTERYRGQEITLTIERGKEVFDAKLVPRISPPAGEGAMGVALVRTAIKKYPWHQAIWQGVLATGNYTLAIIQGYYGVLFNVFRGIPSGVQLMGPVGVFDLLGKASQLGFTYFLNFLALIAIYLAIFNLLPIPVVDGGKLLFLGIEAVRRKPVNPKIEQNITAVFFVLLVALAILVTIKDISRIF